MFRAARALMACAVLWLGLAGTAEPKPPVLVGADLGLSDLTSTSDEAILLGIKTAIDEINAAGGVLGGRPLKVVALDNRDIPARGRENVEKLAAMPDMVAFFVGKFSPVAFESLDLVAQHKLPMLDPWAAADDLVDNGQTPNLVFRLSLRDDWAIAKMIQHGRARGLTRFGLLAPANAWGRSCQRAAEAYARKHDIQLVSIQNYYWGGEKSMASRIKALHAAGAQAVLLVANEAEGVLLVRDMAARAPEDRLPVISHWGITGGNFFQLAGAALHEIDITVVQTRNFTPLRNAAARRLAKIGMEAAGVATPAQIPSSVGLANAYDLTHLLARAITQAGSTDRLAIARALERLPPYEGVVRRYQTPFTPTRHEALSPDDVLLARWNREGDLKPLGR